VMIRSKLQQIAPQVLARLDADQLSHNAFQPLYPLKERFVTFCFWPAVRPP
jgi:hypothetical protein